MAKEEKSGNFAYLAIVAIVAVVALVVMIKGGVNTDYDSSLQLDMGELGGDSIGQPINLGDIISGGKSGSRFDIPEEEILQPASGSCKSADGTKSCEAKCRDNDGGSCTADCSGMTPSCSCNCVGESGNYVT